jgi:hypothetical protein
MAPDPPSRASTRSDGQCYLYLQASTHQASTHPHRPRTPSAAIRKPTHDQTLVARAKKGKTRTRASTKHCADAANEQDAVKPAPDARNPIRRRWRQPKARGKVCEWGKEEEEGLQSPSVGATDVQGSI